MNGTMYKLVVQILFLLCLVACLQTADSLRGSHKHHHHHHHHDDDSQSETSPRKSHHAVEQERQEVNLLESSAVTKQINIGQTVNERTLATPFALSRTESTLNQATLRLIGGDTPSSGRVEVFHDGKWGTVCDDGFNIDDGNVVCRALGLGLATSVSCCGAFGQGTGPIWLSNLACTGKELRLDECKGTSWGATTTCQHAEDAGVSCSAVDCQVSDFEPATPCSAPCGGGQSRRVRRIVTLPTPEGRQCPQPLEIITPCNLQNCPVDCDVTQWGAWSACSYTCGGGTQSRSRTVVTPASDGGAACPPLTDTQLCNTHDCPLDCVVGEWSIWADCDTPCGVGQRSRTRAILTPSAFGGRDCGMLSMQQACNTHPCPINCVTREWSSWGACTLLCGNGTQTRTRSVFTPAAFGGTPCGALTDELPCNEDPCPIDCILSEWGPWGECDRLCGNGLQDRSRQIERPPQFGGVPCGPTRDSQACNVQPCKMDYVRNLIDRVRRLELQNRVAKLEQLQAKLAGLAAKQRAEEILEQAKNMQNAAAPLYIPIRVPPVVDQSTAHTPTPVDPFPQYPARSSSSHPLFSSSPFPFSSSSFSSTGAANPPPGGLMSLYEKTEPFPSALLLETEEHRRHQQHHKSPPTSTHPLSRRLAGEGSKNNRKLSDKHRQQLQTLDDTSEAAEALLQVASDSNLMGAPTETRQNAMLAFAELVAAAVHENDAEKHIRTKVN